MGFKIDYFNQVFFYILPFVKNTFLIAIVSFIIALLISLALASFIQYRIPVLDKFSKIYVSFFRSTPLLAQLFFFYFGLSQIFESIRDMSGMTVLIICMAMNEAAVMSESIRGSFLSIEKGQFEAAHTIGMSKFQTMVHVIIPQAFVVALPSLSNSFVCLIKGSAVGFTVGVLELMTAAKIEIAKSYRGMEAYISILIIYWVLVILISFFQDKLEKKLNEKY